MVSVFSNGQMAESIKAIGRMVSSTERVSILDRMARREKANGKKANE